MTNEASSEHRKATAAAISPGSAAAGHGDVEAVGRRPALPGGVGLVGDLAGVHAEPGGHEAGADAVGADAVVDVLDGDGSRELEHPALRRVVGAALAGGHERRGGADRDDGAAARLEEVRDRRPHGEEHTGEVDPDHRVPRVEAHAVGRARVGQAGAGDDGVEPAEGSDHRGRGGGDRLLVADVADGPDGGSRRRRRSWRRRPRRRRRGRRPRRRRRPPRRGVRPWPGRCRSRPR